MINRKKIISEIEIYYEQLFELLDLMNGIAEIEFRPNIMALKELAQNRLKNIKDKLN